MDEAVVAAHSTDSSADEAVSPVLPMAAADDDHDGRRGGAVSVAGPAIEMDEYLVLAPEEAFFLAWALGCLTLHDGQLEVREPAVAVCGRACSAERAVRLSCGHLVWLTPHAPSARFGWPRPRSARCGGYCRRTMRSGQ